MCQACGSGELVWGQLCGRKCEANYRAFSFAALQRDVSAVRFDQCLRDGETLARAAHASVARARFVRAIKTLEHARLLGGGDPWTAILH